jgi:8-oxo-dGTP diphosphatase
LSSNKLQVVCAALFNSDGLVLVQQRAEKDPLAGLWEFPGGKCEPGESPQNALSRELAEELTIVAEPTAMRFLGESEGLAGDRPLILCLYACPVWSGTAVGLSASALRWIAPSDLHQLAMPAADIPLIALLT